MITNNQFKYGKGKKYPHSKNNFKKLNNIISLYMNKII